MSEITTNGLCYPPAFPAQGRLPLQVSLTGDNLAKQESQERAYRQELCLASERRVAPPCCKTLHISLFFDGTGNNLNNDLFVAREKKRKGEPAILHPTNIARLFRATIGQGHAGGLTDKSAELLDGDGTGETWRRQN